MASQQQFPRLSKFRSTVEYFDKYDFPLTKQELIYWFSPGSVGEISRTGSYYHLPGREKIVKLRQEREVISKRKWKIATQVAEKLKMFPTIRAVFVTGALAMNNSPKDDDIDLMIITSTNTLWITRFFVVIYLVLSRQRRPAHLPEHSSLRVADKICDNVWLDESNLFIGRKDLYTAHEILQAKAVWSRSSAVEVFLSLNSWVENFLPNANNKLTITNRPNTLYFWQVLAPINALFFAVQYLFMWPRRTSEQVGFKQAFFHPKKM